jgi:hypothetical protein
MSSLELKKNFPAVRFHPAKSVNFSTFTLVGYPDLSKPDFRLNSYVARNIKPRQPMFCIKCEVRLTGFKSCKN